MPKEVTIYHKTDGAVVMRSAYVDDALAFAEEWSTKPWPGQDEPPGAVHVIEAPAEEPAPRRRRTAPQIEG